MFEEHEENNFLRRLSDALTQASASARLARPSAPSPSKRIFSPVFLLAIVPFLSRPSAATLVVFADGRTLHVERYEVVPGDEDEGDRLSMTFGGGGSMTVSLEVVDRVVDDEYERPPAPAPGAEDARLAAETGPFALRSLRSFSETLSVAPSVSSPYSSQILAAAKEHKVDPALIAAVIRAESNGVPTAVSRKGARGLMQLMPATARRLGVRRPFDPRENIRGGTAYLAELAQRYGDTRADLVLAAYNAGERAVEEHKGVPPYRETREYVRRVLAFWSGAASGAVAAGASAF